MHREAKKSTQGHSATWLVPGLVCLGLAAHTLQNSSDFQGAPVSQVKKPACLVWVVPSLVSSLGQERKPQRGGQLLPWAFWGRLLREIILFPSLSSTLP